MSHLLSNGHKEPARHPPPSAHAVLLQQDRFLRIQSRHLHREANHLVFLDPQHLPVRLTRTSSNLRDGDASR
jgi:hypothetical protein